jgi:hypothetical protein
MKSKGCLIPQVQFSVSRLASSPDARPPIIGPKKAPGPTATATLINQTTNRARRTVAAEKNSRNHGFSEIAPPDKSDFGTREPVHQTHVGC